MALTDLIHRGRDRSLAPLLYGEERDPFLALYRNMNRMLDDFTSGFGLSPASTNSWLKSWPHLEVKETDNEVKVIADLPGLDEKDVDVSLHDGILTLKGEKKIEEKKSDKGNAVYSERWHGQFHRSLQLGPDVDPEKVSASFKNGELTITLTKRAEAQSDVKRIPVNSG